MSGIIQRAAELYGKIANDLTGFGGHLECATCGRVQSLGDVARSLRTGWPECHGSTMRWWTDKELRERGLPDPMQYGAEQGRDFPDGYQLTWRPENQMRGGLRWRVIPSGFPTRRCRYGSPRNGYCRMPAIAELNRARASAKHPLWWAYCADHLYGRVICDGRLWTLILEPIDPRRENP